MVKVYISSAYTLGDVARNVRRQIDVAEVLYDEGFLPYQPLLSHFHQMVYPHQYNDWLRITREWLLVCDCVLRLDGDSYGADKEVEIAKKYKIPVFNEVSQIVKYYKKDCHK